MGQSFFSMTRPARILFGVIVAIFLAIAWTNLAGWDSPFGSARPKEVTLGAFYDLVKQREVTRATIYQSYVTASTVGSGPVQVSNLSRSSQTGEDLMDFLLKNNVAFDMVD